MPKSIENAHTARQLAAIMFTDIVGYTAMMGQDESETLALVHRHQKIQKSHIEHHNGTVVKELGDGLLAYFPNAESAVQCSYALQTKTKLEADLKIRIGLHWAEIIIENNDIYGDGVNIASRIEGLAEPGGVYMSSDFYENFDADELDVKFLGEAKLKNVSTPVNIYALQGESLPIPSIKRFNELANPKKKLPILPTVIIFLILAILTFITVNYLDNQSKIHQAEASIAQIHELMSLNWRDLSKAYYKAKEAEAYIPDNPELKSLIDQCSVTIRITTEPSGSAIYIKQYNNPNDTWQYLGTTPIDSVQVPAAILRWKIEKEGYEPIIAAALTYRFKDLTHMQKANIFIGKNFHRVLDKTGSIPEGMTRVAGNLNDNGNLPDFFIDKYEVTNQQYKKFVDHGGYHMPEYWLELKDSTMWQDAINSFVDKTGQSGPASWSNGSYPSAHDNYPVNGINWYEANAFARFVGKSLPTKDHWGLARGENNFMIKFPHLGGNAIFAPFSNFHGDGPVEVGSLPGITSYGAYDMAGNVREWCWNESTDGRWMRGGAWNDNPYMFGAPSQASPYDRSERNGFRCALYPNIEDIPNTAFIKADDKLYPQDLSSLDSVSKEEFNLIREQYNYDKVGLFEKIISVKDNDKGWRLEKVEFDVAYDNQRMIAYMFIPTNAKPPYQTVIYGPGSNVLWQTNSDSIETFFEYTAFLEFIVRSGRAAVFPVHYGAFERKEETPSIFLPRTYKQTNFITKVVKDYRRCLDYLETRNDIDLNRVAFYGMSMGPTFGTILAAVDSRIKTNIFYAGGLHYVSRGRPESDGASFLPKIEIPTLMINGKYDSIIGLEGIMNMYNLLGTPNENKKLILLDSDHLAPQEELVKETLAWLDQYFGQVVNISDVTNL